MKWIYYVLLVLTAWCILARCFIQKERWNDRKATKIFKSKNVPLSIHDTLINNRHVHYAVTGEDSLPTIVFIHGSPGSWFHYFKFMQDEEMRRKFRVISFDRPGFGFSDFGKAMHLQEQSKLLVPVLKSLKKDKPFYLCGHSYGGPLVAQIAADDPTLPDKLIIVAGSLSPLLEAKETWRHIMSVPPLFWMLPGAFAPSNTELLYLKKDLVPLGEDLKKITCDVLFIHGDKDTWVPISNIEYSNKMMINASSLKADTLFGADHQIPWKKRDELKQILLGL